LAKASAQFRQSDVTSWGIIALVCGGIAVMGANISAVIPTSVLGGLHKTRIEGASLDQLRLQVAELREQTMQLKRDNTVLTTRFALAEQQGNAVQQRVGSLEVSLPRLLELQPPGPAVDRTAVTAAIGDAQVFEADGGSVTVRRQPMAGATGAGSQPLPEIVDGASLAAPNAMAFGMALGAAIPAEQALGAWNDLSLKLGPLLFGLSPLLADAADGSDKRIVVGPIADLSEVTALCGRLERISIACLPVPFTGTPLRN
tara:strand:+ start:289 stop:1062 length:774 start_codon:yes stop_codon:yes gene_type:complete